MRCGECEEKNGPREGLSANDILHEDYRDPNSEFSYFDRVHFQLCTRHNSCSHSHSFQLRESSDSLHSDGYDS